MEFQLNKIDTSIRRKLQEKTSDDKVHRKSKVKIEQHKIRNGDTPMKARIPGAGGQSRAAMLQQVQKAQEDMQTLQTQLEETEYEGSAAGGQVTVVADGKHRVKKITISPEVVDPEDTEMLEDLVCVAVNNAIEKASSDNDEKMSAITGGLNIPGLL